MKSKKVLLVVLLAAAMAMGVFAGGTKEKQTEAATGPVNLRWFMWAPGEAQANQWNELAADVTAKHPNIRIELETTSFADYFTKLQPQIAARQTADILSMQSLRAYSFFSRGGFQPMNQYIEEDSDINIGDFNEFIIEALSYNDQIYALPYDAAGLLVFYNRDLFDRYGVSYPDDSWTWESFLEASKKLTQDGNFGFATFINLEHAVPWLWGAGGHYWDASTGRWTIDTPANVRGMKFLTDLFTTHRVAKPITDPGAHNWHREQFYSGTIGMVIDGAWFMSDARTNSRFNIGVAALPTGPSGRNSPGYGSGFGISEFTRYPDEVYLAVKSLTSTASLSKLARWGRGYPARLSAVPAYFEGAQGIHNVNVVQTVIDRDLRPLVGPNNFQQVFDTFRQNIEPAYLGLQPVEQSLRTVEQAIERFNR